MLFLEKFLYNSISIPNNIAISSSSINLTYNDLNLLSTKVSLYLKENRLKKFDYVIISSDRSYLLVVTIIACIKAGIVFSIVDSSLPDQYLKSYTDILKPKKIISINKSCSSNIYQQTVRLDEKELEKIKEYQNFECFEYLSKDDGVLVTFTSGSTGKPKAVLGRYSSVTYFYDYMNQKFGDFRSDIFGMCSNISHDPLQRDIFTPLYFGATLAIPNKEDIFESEKFPEWLSKNQVSVICLTPAMYKLLTIYNFHNIKVDSLRLIFFVGEALNKEYIIKLKKIIPNSRIINLYGSTETQRAVSYFEVPESIIEINDLPDIIPVGKGMKDTEVVIINKATMRRCDFDEVGDIYIKSNQIAKCYLDNDIENKNKFLTNIENINSEIQNLYYKTGDIGLNDKEYGVRVIGREDDQLKIDGHRVEPEYINNIILSTKRVNDSYVLGLEENNSIKITAFIVPNQSGIDQNELWELMANELPSYMIPSSYIFINKIPITYNGKVDKKILLEHAKTKKYKQLKNNAVIRKIESISGSRISSNSSDLPISSFGINSILLIELVTFLNKKFMRNLTNRITTSATINDIINIEKQSSLKKQIIYPEVNLIKRYGKINEINEEYIRWVRFFFNDQKV